MEWVDVYPKDNRSEARLTQTRNLFVCVDVKRTALSCKKRKQDSFPFFYSVCQSCSRRTSFVSLITVLIVAQRGGSPPFCVFFLFLFAPKSVRCERPSRDNIARLFPRSRTAKYGERTDKSALQQPWRQGAENFSGTRLENYPREMRQSVSHFRFGE